MNAESKQPPSPKGKPERAGSLARAGRKAGEDKGSEGGGGNSGTGALVPVDNAAAALHAEMVNRWAGSVLDEIDALAQAVTVYVTKDGNIHEKPEWGARLKAAELKLNYMLGRPIERAQVLHGKQSMSLDDLIREAAKSPALLAGLVKKLEAIGAKTSPNR